MTLEEQVEKAIDVLSATAAAVHKVASTPPAPAPKYEIPRVLAAILAIRFMLLIGLAGGFFLACEAMQKQTVISVVVVAAYAALVIAPICYVEARKIFSEGGGHDAT